MLVRCLIQPLRTSILLSRSSRSVLIFRDSNFKGQMISDRKLSVTQLYYDKQSKNNPSEDNLNNYERLREKLRTKTSSERKNLLEFEEELAQLGLVQKFKKIVSEYYHVIILVHLVTSTIWFAIMCIVKFQFNITPEPIVKYLENVKFLDKYQIPEFMFKPLKNEYFKMIAVPFFLYKCVTPLRYYTTIAGSMAAIRYLMPKGIIAPKETPRIIQILYGKYKKN